MRDRVGRRDVKAEGSSAQNQVCDNGQTVQAVELGTDILSMDMEAACEGGSDLAHVDIIFYSVADSR